MTTAANIVERALRKIGVAASGEALQADDLQDGLEAMNAMMFAWKLAGVDTGHTALVAIDDFPLGAEFEEGTVYVLASRLSPDYEAPQAFDADDWFRKMQAAYTVIEDVVMPSALLSLPSRRSRSV